MALDLYVGPLCRFYGRDFTSDFAAWSQSSLGKTPITVTDRGDVVETTPATELLPVILGWRRFITPQFRSAGVPMIDWTETPAAPAKSSRIGWDAYWSLRLLAAYEECPELRRPDEVPEDLGKDAAMGSIRDNFAASRYPHLHCCELWLPLRCADPVTVQTPTEQIKPVGAVSMLRAELDQIRTRILGISSRELLQGVQLDAAKTPLVRGAAGGLAIWLQLCDLAIEQRLPMVLDA